MSGLSIYTFGQQLNCDLLHEGLFKLATEQSGTTMIKRVKNIQIEENISLGFKIIYRVTWINNCTYELRFKELTKGDIKFIGNKDDVFTVQITSIGPKSYLAKSSANFSDGFLEREIFILE